MKGLVVSAEPGAIAAQFDRRRVSHARVSPNFYADINSSLLRRAIVVEGHRCMFMLPVATGKPAIDSLAEAPLSDAEIVSKASIATRQFGQLTHPDKLMVAMIKEHSGLAMSYLDRCDAPPVLAMAE